MGQTGLAAVDLVVEEVVGAKKSMQLCTTGQKAAFPAGILEDFPCRLQDSDQRSIKKSNRWRRWYFLLLLFFNFSYQNLADGWLRNSTREIEYLKKPRQDASKVAKLFPQLSDTLLHPTFTQKDAQFAPKVALTLVVLTARQKLKGCFVARLCNLLGKQSIREHSHMTSDVFGGIFDLPKSDTLLHKPIQ